MVDATDPAAVRAAAQRVEAVVDCSGRESVELAEAVLAGGAHLVDISANCAYQQAVTQRITAEGGGSHEVLFSVGLTPGLTNLLADLRHAFQLFDYPVGGRVTGEFHLYGKYETPFGFGRLQIDDGVAYDEPFERATASLRFEGAGVRLDGIEASKSGGRMTGAAYVGWEGTYSFNFTGRRVPVESVYALTFPQAPLTGQLGHLSRIIATSDPSRA